MNRKIGEGCYRARMRDSLPYIQGKEMWFNGSSMGLGGQDFYQGFVMGHRESHLISLPKFPQY